MDAGCKDTYEFTIEDERITDVAVSWPTLKRALSDASTGDTIYIAGNRHLVADTSTLDVVGVSIVSDGATIEMPETRDGDLFRATNAEFRGLSVIAPETDRREWPGYGEGHISRGINANGTTRVVNCHLEGFGHAAVACGRERANSSVEILGCELVHNNMGGLGYGAVADGQGAHVSIRHTYMNDNRHSVAAKGGVAASWSVVNCHHGPETRLHAFDTHKPGLRAVEFRQNRSEVTTNETIRVRGSVDNGGEIKHNWFEHTKRDEPGEEGSVIRVGPANSFRDAGLDVRDNLYSKEPPSAVFPE